MKKTFITVLSLVALSATSAYAHTSVGFGFNFGGPVYAPAPVAYYPPPVYGYAPPPPPVYYPPYAYAPPPPYYYGGYPYYGGRYRGYWR